MQQEDTNATHRADENTPLISTAGDAVTKKRRTPLPKLQLAIVIFLQIGEPLSSQSIYPYINQLIRELDITGGDDRKVGYYAGLIESLFFATEAMTVLHWGRISDRLGRKPVLLCGLLGSMISILCFGLSRTYWALILSRCLTGLLNGNIGVMKSTLGDLTDSTNRAEAFALLSLVWATGCTLGPLLGGTLYHPHERFPKSFPSRFWEKFPYFLPCLVVALYLLVSFTITLVFFKETIKKPKRHSRLTSEDTLVDRDEIQHQDPSNSSTPLRSLLVYRVLLSVANYAALAFLNICMYALFPLFLAMPVEIGGLGINPPTIGLALAIYGGISGATQTLVFAKVVRYFGPRKTFVNGMFCFIPAFALFPIISIVGRHYGVNGFPVWALVSGILACLAVSDMGWGAIFMFITASAPNRKSLGATNGLAQMAVSTARAIGPAMSTSLFSLSVERHIFGGYGVYGFMVLLAIGAFGLATQLPEEVWVEADED